MDIVSVQSSDINWCKHERYYWAVAGAIRAGVAAPESQLLVNSVSDQMWPAGL